MGGDGPRTRRPRRDAEANRERVLAAAVSVMLREGRNAPLADIAAEAGVGVATLYRKYRDRTELLQALEHRAYRLLNDALDDIEREAAAQTWSGLDCIDAYVSRSIEIGDHLVLPLHGAPPLVDDGAVTARRDINRRLDAFIERGAADGSVRAQVNATDVIVFSALITQPLRHGPDWDTLATRQKVLFLNGLAGDGPARLPERRVAREDIERSFATRAQEEGQTGLDPTASG
jgi:AcrR family transcriptional regulator